MMSMYEANTPGTLTYATRRIARGKHVSREELSSALRSNNGTEIPQSVQNYLADILDGRERRTRGVTRNQVEYEIRLTYLGAQYRRLLRVLRSAQKRGRMDCWPQLADQDWWQGPPHERASRIIAHRLNRDKDGKVVRNASWQHIRNELNPFIPSD